MKKKKLPHSQLELPVTRRREPDRNADKGGRSFYFFDLDDNVLHLPTEIVVFHRATSQEVHLSTADYAQVHSDLGKRGKWADFELREDPKHGSFRYFRSHGTKKHFVDDIRSALQTPEYVWKGPSWSFFYHAVFNGRPLTLITARGQDPDELREGLAILAHADHLPWEPNYLGIFPVSHPETRVTLGDRNLKAGVPELKRLAIHESVRRAFEKYETSPFHRFGMSDDDPKNLERAIAAFRELKAEHPKNRFYVFDAARTPIQKQEVLMESTRKVDFDDDVQLDFFKRED